MAPLSDAPIDHGGDNNGQRGKTGRKPQAYVRFQRRKNSKGYDRLEMQVGRAVWYDAGRPDRLALEWVGKQLRLVSDQEGWKLHIRSYATPRCWLPLDIEIVPGRYSAYVQEGAIYLGERELEERARDA